MPQNKKRSFIGRRYGRLVVIQELPSLRREGIVACRMFLCRCDCGNQKPIRHSSLYGDRVLSCGCLRREIMRVRASKHGHAPQKAHSPTYRTWNNMRTRCTNPKFKDWQYYGGRGIKVCDRWLVFENFLADMGERPKGRSLDRRDVNGNYEPDNCRWATNSEQRLNQRPRQKKKRR